MNWLFLRGLSREQRHWGDFAATFEREVRGAHVHCLDLPGTGTEHGRASPSRVQDIAEDLRARWITLRDGNEGPWALLGMSLGGMVAMSWCAAHPEDFERVVLVSTSAGDLSRPWKRFALGALRGTLASVLQRDPVRREARVLSMVTRLAPRTGALAEAWASYQRDRPVSRSNVGRQLRAGTRFVAPRRFATPALVLAGAGDAMTDPSCARILAAHLGARCDVHPEAGHEMALDAPAWLSRRVGAWVEAARARRPPSPGGAVREAPLGDEGHAPLVIQPGPAGDRSVAALLRWIEGNASEVRHKLTLHGALLFRDFEVDTAPAFESVARAVDPELKNDYLGTSPRNAITPYVFSASELPSYYPIPQHCEMSFTKHPPRRLFFCCLTPSSGPGGETPLADFRHVLRDLEPALRARFEAKGVRNIRNYAGPEGGSRLDLWKLKRWDEMFGTRDERVVEQKCRENGFDFAWRPGGQLTLTNTQPALKRHPVTGELAWFNHAQVFHLSAAAGEYRRIAERLGKRRYEVLAGVADTAVRLKRRAAPDEEQAMHCTYGDGAPIADDDMDRLRDAIWKNMAFFTWRRGDVVVIDNDSMSHGRMPYQGPRAVAVSWA
jgi:pimeloyl-ACP methyl ester carboxylesterase